MTRSPRRALALGALAACLVLLAACGDDDGDDGDLATEVTEDTTTSTTAAPAAPELSVTAAWARTSPMVATNGAAYFTVTNTGTVDDALVAAAVGPEVAGKVELHETVAVDGGMSGNMGDETPTTGAGTAMMEMRPVDRIEVPAGGSAELAPGGYHVMLLDLAEPLVVGETFEMTLTFEEAGEQVVMVEIRDAAP